MIPYALNPLGISAGSLIPTDGLVFYAPLDKSAATAATGQALTNVNATFVTLDGIKCARVGATSPNSYISTSAETLPEASEVRTFSLWLNTDTGGTAMCYGYGNSAFNQAWMQGLLCFSQYGNSIQYTGPSLNVWHNVITTYNGTTVKCYVDGVLKGQKNFALNTYSPYPMYIGATERLREIAGIHHIAHFRVYDRVISQDEINILATELKPKRG